MVSVISFCLKTHPGFRVQITPSAYGGEFLNISVNQYGRSPYCKLIYLNKYLKLAMPLHKEVFSISAEYATKSQLINVGVQLCFINTVE